MPGPVLEPSAAVWCGLRCVHGAALWHYGLSKSRWILNVEKYVSSAANTHTNTYTHSHMHRVIHICNSHSRRTEINTKTGTHIILMMQNSFNGIFSFFFFCIALHCIGNSDNNNVAGWELRRGQLVLCSLPHLQLAKCRHRQAKRRRCLR